MDRIKVGIIGCGKFALAQHLPNCVAAENIEMVHCSSLDEPGRKNAERFNPKKTTADYRDVLADPEVDMVIVAVPHEWHKFYLEETVKAGKHVFCEKPMTMTMADAYGVIKLVRRHGVKLCVDYNRCFSPAMVDMKRAYHAHKANPTGRPRVYLQEPNRQTWAEELQTMFTIRINDESCTYGGMHIDWKEGGGLVIGEGCHWLNLMCWMLEERPVRITAVGSTRLSYVITIEFDGGSLGCLAFGVGGTFEWPKELLELQHRGKIFRSECFVENHYFGLGERTVRKFPLQSDPQPQVGGEGGHKTKRPCCSLKTRLTNQLTVDRGADFERCLRPQGDFCRYPARLSATIGKCRHPSWNSISSSTTAPGVPRTKACGFALGEPRGQRWRTSNLGRRLAGNRFSKTSLGVRARSQEWTRCSLHHSAAAVSSPTNASRR